jgi:hypothetical protein
MDTIVKLLPEEIIIAKSNLSSCCQILSRSGGAILPGTYADTEIIPMLNLVMLQNLGIVANE